MQTGGESVIGACVKVPLHLEPGGWATSPLLDLDDRGDLLYIFQDADYPGVWGWVSWHAPSLAVLVGVIALVALLWRVRRVWRNKRVAGRRYCRGCNYDMTSRVGTAEFERCPECGRGMAGRGTVVGRAVWARLGPAVITAALVWVACIVVMAATLTLEQQRSFLGHEWRLPVATAVQVPGVWRAYGNAQGRTMVRAVALPSGEAHGIAIEEGGPIGQGAVRLSPGGEWLVILDQWATPGRPLPAVRIKDLASGRERPVAWPSVYSYPRLVGFSKDGRRAYVQARTGPAMAPSQQLVTSLHEIDLAGGWTQLVTQVSVASSDQAYFAVDEDASGEVRWALYAHQQAGAGGGGGAQSGRVCVPDEQGAERWFDVSLSGRSFYVPRLVEGGRVLEVPTFGTNMIARVDLESGAVVEVPQGEYVWWSAGMAMPEPPLVAREAPSGPGAFEVVRSGGVGGVLAVLEGMAGTRGAPMVSRSGEWAACVYYATEETMLSRAGVAQPRTRYEVWVWDLRGVAR